MGNESKRDLIDEVGVFLQTEDTQVTMVHHSFSLIDRLGRLVITQQTEIDGLNAIIARLRAENDRLSGMLAGDLPF